MKLPESLKKAAKIRMDYNENHDEKGRFSVSDTSGTHVAGMHSTGAAARARAKEVSESYPEKTFHVLEHDAKGGKKFVAKYSGGKEVTPASQLKAVGAENFHKKARDPLADIPTKPTPSAAAKASATRTFIAQTSRDLEAKDAKRAGTAKAAEHKALRQSILKQQAARVAPDVKSSESPAGTLERARASFGPGQFQTSVPYYSTTHIPSGGRIEDIRTRAERARGMTSPHYIAVSKDGSVSHHSSLDDAMVSMHREYVKRTGRQDYNENHDEKGRFSVSDASGAVPESHFPASQLAQAKSLALTGSRMIKGTTHVHENKGDGSKTLLHTYTNGKEVKSTDRIGTRYGGYNSKQGVKDAGQALRDLQAKNTNAPGTTDYNKGIHVNTKGEQYITGPKFEVNKPDEGPSHYYAQKEGAKSTYQGGPYLSHAHATAEVGKMNAERNAKIDAHMARGAAERDATHEQRVAAIKENQKGGGVGTQAWVDKGLAAKATGRSTAKDVMDVRTVPHETQGWETTITHRDTTTVRGVGRTLEATTRAANNAHAAHVALWKIESKPGFKPIGGGFKP